MPVCLFYNYFYFLVLIILIISGNVSDKGVSGIEHDSAQVKPPIIENPPNVPTNSDMLICYATAHGKLNKNMYKAIINYKNTFSRF